MLQARSANGGKLGTSEGSTLVARDFFSRLTSRALGYFLSPEL
jgi:hypothetical protein